MNAEVRRARKKPVEIEYMVWPGGAENATPILDWILGHDGLARYHEEGNGLIEHLDITTLEGVMLASPGDVIIRGVKGEFYPCKPDIFAATNDLIDA